MPRKNASGEGGWVDPDDAPELDDAFFSEADHRRNGELIQQGVGAGWQTKANALLKEWLKRDPS